MKKAVSEKRAGILTYGITPPKKSHDEARRREIAQRQAARIGALPIDGLVVYDIQDESARTDLERPFPFIEAIDPSVYAYDYLAAVKLPKIVYRCVSHHGEAELAAWLGEVEARDGLCVLVGAASRNQSAAMRLGDAYRVRGHRAPNLPVGGVLIAERHELQRNEDERALHKVEQGCSFFISQAVFSVAASKNVLSDLYYRCQASGVAVPPVLITLSPCGSRKTLEFMRWLGISVPRWMENELLHSQDILESSVRLCTDVFRDLHAFAAAKGIPLGCNVESVSLRKEEIEASVTLVHAIAGILGRPRSAS